MTYEEMKKYIADMVKSQGSQGAIEIAPLLYAMADKMFADPETGVVPIVVSIAEVGNKEGTATRYDITTDQQTINEYIDNVTEEKAKARLFIQDGDALIGFTYLEINGTTITGQSIAPDGSYKLYLSKETGTSYFEHDDEVKSIASVTEAEITGYNKGCAVLHTVKLSGLSSNIDLSDCAQLSVETIEHLIENSIQPGSGTITITVHPDVNNNINNNSSWGNVRALLQEKTYITIQSATA